MAGDAGNSHFRRLLPPSSANHKVTCASRLDATCHRSGDNAVRSAGAGTHHANPFSYCGDPDTGIGGLLIWFLLFGFAFRSSRKDMWRNCALLGIISGIASAWLDWALIHSSPQYALVANDAQLMTIAMVADHGGPERAGFRRPQDSNGKYSGADQEYSNARLTFAEAF